MTAKNEYDNEDGAFIQFDKKDRSVKKEETMYITDKGFEMEHKEIERVGVFVPRDANKKIIEVWNKGGYNPDNN